MNEIFVLYLDALYDRIGYVHIVALIGLFINIALILIALKRGTPFVFLAPIFVISLLLIPFYIIVIQRDSPSREMTVLSSLLRVIEIYIFTGVLLAVINTIKRKLHWK